MCWAGDQGIECFKPMSLEGHLGHKEHGKAASDRVANVFLFFTQWIVLEDYQGLLSIKHNLSALQTLSLLFGLCCIRRLKGHRREELFAPESHIRGWPDWNQVQRHQLGAENVDRWFTLALYVRGPKFKSPQWKTATEGIFIWIQEKGLAMETNKEGWGQSQILHERISTQD